MPWQGPGSCSRGTAGYCAEWLAQVNTAECWAECCIESYFSPPLPPVVVSVCQGGDAKVTFGIMEDDVPASCMPTIRVGLWGSEKGIR